MLIAFRSLRQTFTHHSTSLLHILRFIHFASVLKYVWLQLLYDCIKTTSNAFGAWTSNRVKIVKEITYHNIGRIVCFQRKTSSFKQELITFAYLQLYLPTNNKFICRIRTMHICGWQWLFIYINNDFSYIKFISIKVRLKMKRMRKYAPKRIGTSFSCEKWNHFCFHCICVIWCSAKRTHFTFENIHTCTSQTERRRKNQVSKRKYCEISSWDGLKCVFPRTMFIRTVCKRTLHLQPSRYVLSFFWKLILYIFSRRVCIIITLFYKLSQFLTQANWWSSLVVSTYIYS